MKHKKTTIAQTNAFIKAAGYILVRKRSPYSSTGARRLAPVEPLIRRGVRLGLRDAEIAKCLSKIPDSPVRGLAKTTILQYLSSARIEFGMPKYRKLS